MILTIGAVKTNPPPASNNVVGLVPLPLVTQARLVTVVADPSVEAILPADPTQRETVFP